MNSINVKPSSIKTIITEQNERIIITSSFICEENI